MAANIAIGRNGAGVHYRTDYTASMALGELMAISMLQEQAMFLREGSGSETAFRVERFDGTTVDINYDGDVQGVGTQPGGSTKYETRAGRKIGYSTFSD